MSDCLEDVAAALELRLVRRFAGGVFGAALVRDAQGRELVLKAQPRPELEPAWATGAAMAARLRTDGYPSPRYEAVGRTQPLHPPPTLGLGSCRYRPRRC